LRSNQIFKDTEIGSIPKEWEVVRLENVIKELKNGFASGKRDDDGIVQIRMNNVTTGGHLIFDSFLKVPVPENINKFLLKENDLLFNNTNSIDLVGKSTIFNNVSFPCTFSNHFTRIRFRDEVLPEWVLFHFIKLWRKGFFRSVAIRHVGQAAVQTKYLTSLEIALPPLPEQQKIAEILSTVDQGIEKVDEAVRKTQRLKNGLMQKLLTKGIGHKEFKDTEVGKIPEDWEVKKLGEVITLCQYGLSSKMSQAGKYPIIKMDDIVNGNVVPDKVKYINLDKKTFENFRLEKGDILFNRTNSYELVGRTGIFLLDGEYVFASYLIRLRPKGDVVDSFYLTSYLIFSNEKLRRLATRAVHQANINATTLQKVMVLIPPLPEQQKIAEILGTIDGRLELLRKRKERLERVKKGLMNDLLTGRKRVRLEV
jgi:type I restriction enzyme S subunit